ncbi:MAG: hypothetical protein EKK46_05925 [Rhodocyclaceae bacterium]|nr:MAG: hypothetical protein EKK46_05925 [Rhodocyclaceae bacterium]
MKLRTFILLASMIVSGHALAIPPAVVDAVQMPAWRVRGEKMEPLATGMEVLNGDQVKTGVGARVYLKLAEGSTVKLGESAQMNFHSRSLKPQSFFHGALDVLTGAFRFTTAQVAKLKKRELAIRVGTATIGIRGTDVWGRSGKEQDLVMLIEGHIEVQPAQGEAVTMAEPMSVFIAPKGAAALPLGVATPEEFASRARETDLESGNGALMRQGKFALRLGDALDESGALNLFDRVWAAGYPARLRPVADGQGWRYEVLLKGFASKEAAERAAAPIADALKLSVSVTR